MMTKSTPKLFRNSKLIFYISYQKKYFISFIDEIELLNQNSISNQFNHDIYTADFKNKIRRVEKVKRTHQVVYGDSSQSSKSTINAPDNFMNLTSKLLICDGKGNERISSVNKKC